MSYQQKLSALGISEAGAKYLLMQNTSNPNFLTGFAKATKMNSTDVYSLLGLDLNGLMSTFGISAYEIGIIDSENNNEFSIRSNSFTFDAQYMEYLSVTNNHSDATGFIKNATTLTNVSFSGAYKTKVNMTLGSELQDLSVSAASASGGVDISLSGKNNTFIGGNGNDRVFMKSDGLGSLDNISGGSGTDTIVLNGINSMNNLSRATGFEILEIFSPVNTLDFLNVSLFTGNKIVLNNATVVNLDNAGALDVDVNSVTALTARTDGSQSKLTLNVSDNSFKLNTGTFSAIDLNIKSFGTKIELGGIKDGAVFTINDTSDEGNASVHFTLANRDQNDKTITINASELSNTVHGPSFRATAVTEIYNTGSGDDILYVAAGGNDLVNSGSGNDRIYLYGHQNSAYGTSSVTTGLGDDVVYLVKEYYTSNGDFSITDFTIGNDKLFVGSVISSAINAASTINYTGQSMKTNFDGINLVVLNDGVSRNEIQVETVLKSITDLSNFTKTNVLVMYQGEDGSAKLAYDVNTLTENTIIDMVSLSGVTTNSVASNADQLFYVF